MRSLTYIEIDIPPFIWDFEKVLLHLEGADASTTILDEAYGTDTGHAWTCAGNAQLDTADKKFGAASALFDGTGDYITTPDHTDFTLGSGDFTVDFWFKCNATSGTLRRLAGQCNSTPTNAGTAWRINRTTGNFIEAVVCVGSTAYTLTTAAQYTSAVNTGWHHCALARFGNVLSLYIDGALAATTAISGTVNDSADVLAIGTEGAVTSNPWLGWIDEFRLTVGAARWTKAFTSPTVAEATTDRDTYRFAMDTDYLPSTIDAIASLQGVSYTPATVSIGADLGQRATLRASFKDHRHIFLQGVDTFSVGTFWGKFRARYGNRLRSNKLRWITGLEGQAIGDMETRHYMIESVEGPTPQGNYSILAKDILKFADDDRSQAPRPSTGRLNTTMTTTTTDITLTPTGVANLEYPATGYVNIGGTEIAAFARDASAGNDASTVLLLHCEGVDASTTFTDSSTNARAATANGNVQIDTADQKWGSSSALFDGTGDFISYLDNAAWTFAGDFTLECQAKFSSLAAARTLICHSTDINNMYRLFVTATGALTFVVISASATIITLASTTGLIVTGTWYHLAVVRFGNVFKLYIDGVEVATTTDVDAIPNFTSTFKIGVSGNGTSDAMLGWIDEVRISSVARWTDDFTPPVQAYQTSADILVVTRGALGTTAATHEQGERMQLVLTYSGLGPDVIISDLMRTYAAVDTSYIDATAWNNEVTAFLQRQYTANIAEPTGVRKLVSELIEQAALIMWWDDIGEKIRLQVIRPIATDVATFDENNTLKGSLRIMEQPEKRISQVYTYFNQRDPLKEDKEDNFKSAALTIDLVADAAYGTAIKKIFSRWIPTGGRTTALRLNDLVIGRFKDAPRRFNYDVFRYDNNLPVLGGGYNVKSFCIQDIKGAPSFASVQVTRLNPMADKFSIEAEEMLFSDFTPDDLSQRIIIIDADQHNVNMRTLHDQLYPAPTGSESPAVTVTCYIESGVIVGSDRPVDRGTPLVSFNVGDWPSGITLVLVVNGEIQGHGGVGGDGCRTGSPLTINNGGNGGTALYCRETISITNNGAIRGGGGGGGGGGIATDDGSGGGGGGQGEDPGLGGLGQYNHKRNGADGTATGGGAGGNDGGFDGGAGSAWGTAGVDGADFPGFGVNGGIGGPAGIGIDGISHITLTGSGTVNGTQIN